ncbi:hypothetical protein C5167_017474 [Papaver somniferum]|uniref:Glucan endo-1,3-beta-D-glucosidase n=1 Tax=Papaver somniferum TaxID=3469 RepID=A0A4Y7IMN6_PAPSO|nr:hypothetical protein C5167_017474 [Papaver somniferum]
MSCFTFFSPLPHDNRTNADVISLDYALFHENPGVVDSGNGLKYSNLVDAQVDDVYAAIKDLKYDDVDIFVTKTGWPSNGDKEEIGANPENSQAYNGGAFNLFRRISFVILYKENRTYRVKI